MHIIRQYPQLAGLFALCVIIVVVLPRFVWLSLVMVAPPLVAFIVAIYTPLTFWDEDEDAPHWGAIAQSAGIAGALFLALHGLFLLVGSRLFMGGGLLTLMLNVLVFGVVPVVGGISAGLILTPAWRTVVIGIMGVFAGVVVLILDALVPINLLWLLIAPPLVSAGLATWRAGDVPHDLALRAGLVAGGLASGIPALTIALTVRAVLCLGATACTQRFDLGAAVVLYGVTALMMAILAVFVGLIALSVLLLHSQQMDD